MLFKCPEVLRERLNNTQTVPFIYLFIFEQYIFKVTLGTVSCTEIRTYDSLNTWSSRLQ